MKRKRANPQVRVCLVTIHSFVRGRIRIRPFGRNHLEFKKKKTKRKIYQISIGKEEKKTKFNTFGDYLLILP